MVSLTNVIRETAEKFNLGNRAEPLVALTARLIFESHEQGLKGFLAKLGKQGLGDAWIKGASPLPELDPEVLQQAFGIEAITKAGHELGLANARVREAMAFIVPELVKLFAQNGEAPTEMPYPLETLLQSGHARVPPPKRNTGRKEASFRVKSQALPSFWSVGVLILLSTGIYMAYQLWQEKVVDKSAAENPVVPAQIIMPPKQSDRFSGKPQARLTIRNHDGNYDYVGAVGDPDLRKTIEDRMMTVWGASKFNGRLAIESSLAEPLWFGALDKVLPLLDKPGIDVRFDAASVKVGGWLKDSDRQHALATIKEALGAGFTYGFLMDEPSELARDAHDLTMTQLSTLPLNFQGADLVAALNNWVVNFPEGSAVFPSDNRAIAIRAVARMRSMVQPVIMEVGVYIDAHGHEQADLILTEERANAIRDVMVKAGLPPLMLRAKGYGSSKPIVANDSPYGRFRNRRVEFRVLEVCSSMNPCSVSKEAVQKNRPPEKLEEKKSGIVKEPLVDSAQKVPVKTPEKPLTSSPPPAAEPGSSAPDVIPAPKPTKPKSVEAPPRPVKAEDLF